MERVEIWATKKNVSQIGACAGMNEPARARGLFLLEGGISGQSDKNKSKSLFNQYFV
jgi:hypothetical protein